MDAAFYHAPRVALTLGIVGHRADRIHGKIADEVHKTIYRLIKLLDQKLESILATDVECDGPFCRENGQILSLISALAEGSDLIAAEAAIDAHIALDVILPFSREVSRADGRTDPAGQARYDAVLNKARSTLVLDLPDNTDKRAAAYDLAGRILVGQSDIMIAVWDGGPSGGRGGTREMIERALRIGLPIIHIHPAQPQRAQLMWQRLQRFSERECHIDDMQAHAVELHLDADDGCAELTKMVSRITEAPPELRAKGEQNKSPKRHDTEAARHFLEDQNPAPDAGLRNEAKNLREAIAPFGDDELQLPEDERDRSPLTRMLNAYAAADATANRFGNEFRRTVICIFICSAVAIIAAALAAALPHIIPQHSDGPSHGNSDTYWMLISHLVLALIELTAIGFMIYLTRHGRNQQIHRRWIDAREVAERMRQTIIFWTLGIWPWPLSEANGWIGWYVRAHQRQQSLCDNGDGRTWKSDIRRILIELIEGKEMATGARRKGQIDYHNDNVARMQKLIGRYELATAISLFGLTLLPLLTFIALSLLQIVSNEPTPHRAGGLLDVLEAYLAPGTITFAAASFALYGLKTTLDYEGVRERSQRSLEKLQKKQTELATIDDMVELHAFAERLSDLMLEELHHWRITAESRVLDMPG
ncbi:hypothetical protein [Candidatus Raskinella chloraquaticus]|jgi:hypothetical protein|uniref:hypothetical protein n=1 Tax=Candidatus Raskinella chloraquaticus TaxID=1951219 RepID=UPI00366FDC69